MTSLRIRARDASTQKYRIFGGVIDLPNNWTRRSITLDLIDMDQRDYGTVVVPTPAGARFVRIPAKVLARDGRYRWRASTNRAISEAIDIRLKA